MLMEYFREEKAEKHYFIDGFVFFRLISRRY